MKREDSERKPIIEGVEDGGDSFTEKQTQDSLGISWWNLKHYLDQPTLFGTWDGVFVSAIVNTFGVIVFLRSGWTVANAGIIEASLILLLSTFIVLLPILSAIVICQRCGIKSGGVYFLVSHVLGGKFGTVVGLVYVFAQAVAGSVVAVGFGESMVAILKIGSVWIAKGFAATVSLLLAGVNMAGVKWVVKVQLFLFFLLVLSIFDFTAGTFATHRPTSGITSLSAANFRNNTYPAYEKGENFFTVFGVYFSTFTGVLSGVNMSGDLKNPVKNISIGELTALAVNSSKAETYGSMSGIKKEDLEKLFTEASRTWEEPFAIRGGEDHMTSKFIGEKSKSWYAWIGNRWTALVGFSVNLVLAFLVNWLYTLLHFLVMFVIYVYISWTNPATFAGISEFSLKNSFQAVLCRFDRLDGSGAGLWFVSVPFGPKVSTTTDCMSEENQDFQDRDKRQHQSAIGQCID